MKYRSTKEERFDSIYRSYVDDLFKVCLYLTKDYDTAQEIVQQTFIKFYSRFESVEPECMYAYLVRTAKNLFYNHQRDLKRDMKADLDMAEQNLEDMVTESLEEVYFRERRKELEAELSESILFKLQEEHENWYQILSMMYFEEKTHDEIAEELGISKEVLYSRIHRAKQWVRKHYEKEFDDIADMS